MQKTQKQAFTLVELIVVITILTILGTIGFLSMQGYSKSARDSTRISDVQNIKKTLELFSVKVGRYPDPTEAQPVTFSGGLAWYQGTFGDSTYRNVERMNKLPVDPLTGLEYTYSLLNTQNKYEISGILETDTLSLLQPTYAAEKTAQAIVEGTYNSIALRINLDTTSYILALPSIITSIDLSVENNRKLETIIPSKQMVLKNQKNLPSNYQDQNYNSEAEITNDDFEIVKDNSIENLIIYEGNIENLTSTILVEKLQNAYSGTTVESIQLINEFKSFDLNNIDEEKQIDDYGINFINYHLGGAAVTKIYNTCDSIPHNTTKSFYTGTGVTFTTGTCDGLKQDFVCRDGTWKDGEITLDTNTYPYDTCNVDEARTCTVLATLLNHDDDLIVYSEDSIAWDATYDCDDRIGNVTCNDGTGEGDTGYQYKVCAKGTPTNCIADANYEINGHTYNVPQLNHNLSSQLTDDIGENNGIYRYTLDITCNNGILNPTETGPLLQSCDTNYTIDGEICKSNCEGGNFDEYTYTYLTHLQTENVSKDTSPLNGTQETTADLTCTDGTISKSNEVAGIITCDSSYYLDGSLCNLQWTGDTTTGYLFKNTSGIEQYPTSCSDLLDQTTWKNTLNGTPWNGTKFTDGAYYIKPDTNPAFKVYCDMTTDGGGWTVILSANGTSTSSDFAGLNSNNYLESSKMLSIANISGEIMIYNTDDKAKYVKSITPIPINKLKLGFSLNINYGGSYYYNGFLDWEGDISVMDFSCDVSTYGGYPLLYSACNNSYGLHFSYTRTMWKYLEGDIPLTLLLRKKIEPSKALNQADGAYRWNDGTYAISCLEYKSDVAYSNEGNGEYWINTGAGPFKVYCDMITDGGGWTLLSYVKDTNSLGLYENGVICSDIGENCRGDLKKLGASTSNTNGFNELMIKHTNDKRVQMEININTPIYKSLSNGNINANPGDFYNMYIIYDNLFNRGGSIDTLRLRFDNNSNQSHWLNNYTIDNINNWKAYATHWDGNDATDESIMKSVGYTEGLSNWNRYSHGFYVREKTIIHTWVGDGTEGNPWKKVGNVMTSCNDFKTSISTNPAGNSWSIVSGIGQDGIYNIDTENNGVGIDIYCDMTTDGGGWRVLGKTFNYSYSNSTVCIDEEFFSTSEIVEIQSLLTQYSEVKIDSDIHIYIQADDSVNNSIIYTTKISDGTSFDIIIGDGGDNTKITLTEDKDKLYCSTSNTSNCGLLNKPELNTSTELLIINRLFFQPMCNNSTAHLDGWYRNQYSLTGTHYKVLFR